jgi:hypothetical protein
MPSKALAENSLRDEIREALIREWDPVGINKFSEAQYEYDAYVSEIFELLVSGASQDRIFSYLWWLETEHMSLPGNRPATAAFSMKLRKLYLQARNLHMDCTPTMRHG